MYDTNVESSSEHIDINIVMESSGFDDDWTLLSLVDGVLSNVYYL